MTQFSPDPNLPLKSLYEISQHRHVCLLHWGAALNRTYPNAITGSHLHFIFFIEYESHVLRTQPPPFPNVVPSSAVLRLATQPDALASEFG